MTTNTQPWTINGKPATQAEIARIQRAGKRPATETKKSRETAVYQPKGFSLMR